MSEIIDKYEASARATNVRRAMEGMGESDLLSLLQHYYIQAKPIKARCHNATQEDIFIVTSLAMAYNRLVPSGRLRATACQIPHNIAKAERYLRGRGVL